jgi:hypothetical protein
MVCLLCGTTVSLAQSIEVLEFWFPDGGMEDNVLQCAQSLGVILLFC